MSSSPNGTSNPLISMITNESFRGFDLKFDELNQRLNSVKKEFGLRRAVSTQSLTGETRTFAEILDSEVELIVLFYLEIQGILARQLRLLRSRQIHALQDINVSLDSIEDLCQKYRDIGQEVLELLNYLDRNSVALRKILLRHDHLFDQKMGSMYFDSRLAVANGLGTESKGAQLRQLYRQEGIRAVVASIRRGFEELYDARKTLMESLSQRSRFVTKRLYQSSNNQEENEYTFGSNHGKTSVIFEDSSKTKSVPKVPFKKRLASFTNLHQLGFQQQQQQQQAFLGRAVSTDDVSTGKPLQIDQRRLLQLQQQEDYLSRKRSLSEIEPVLQKIAEVGLRVMKTQERTTLEFISMQSPMGLEFAMRDISRAEQQALTGQVEVKEIVTSQIGLFLNLLVTFLYLQNQYIVAPSSSRYANMLGMSSAMSGMIIGLTPTAALLGSLLYSKWSNSSFKQPLIFSISCALLGSLLYGAALQYDSVVMVFAGRLLVGFGGPRVISRRYIADHVSLDGRLVASGQFVSAGALGLAFGPLLASLIDRSQISFSWYWPGSKQILLQYTTVTAPGWVMAVLWAISLVLVIFFFIEPNIIQEAEVDQLSRASKAGSRSNSFERLSKQSIVHVETGNELWANENIELPIRKSPHSIFNSASPASFPFNEVPNEKSSLLDNQYHRNSSYAGTLSDTRATKDSSCLGLCDWFNHVSKEVLLILFIYLVNKTGQELAVSSMPLLMQAIFHWTDESIGYYMAIVGALVLPTTVLINSLAKDTEERDMLLKLTYVSIIGVFLILHVAFFGSYTLFQYILGTIILFTSLNAIEGVIMSLLSKLISPELAKGTCNSGLLATEAGTLGRVLGDMAITIFGAQSAADNLVNQLYLPFGILLASTIWLAYRFYDVLAE